MSLPVLLRSTMTGAPQMNGANGTVNAVLNACLVNGFNTQSVTSATASGTTITFNFASAPGFSAGDTVTIAGASNASTNGQFRVQSAASNQVIVANTAVSAGAVGGTITLKFSPLGWTRPCSGTNLGVYRQGGSSATKRYLRADDTTIVSTSYANFRAYEAMTAVSTGTGPFPTSTQAPNAVQIYYPTSGTTNQWLLVGTPRAFALLISPDPASLTSGCRAFFFGDTARTTKPADTYNALITGADGWPTSSFYMPRAYTGAAGAVTAQIASVGGTNSASLGAVYPCAASGGLNLADAPAVYETATTVLRGFLPGMLAAVQAPVHNGGASALPPGAILSGITGVTGRVVVLGAAVGAASDCVMLLDEDWGDT